jgi:hypothetical protein
MKTLVCLLLLTVFSYAAEKPYFTYSNFHTMGSYPMFGAGIRIQNKSYALDFSGNTCVLNPPNSLRIVHFRSLYLAYPKETSFYFGGGLGFLNEPETINVSGSLESSIGYQWGTRFFIEGNAILPFKHSPVLAPIWPGLTCGVGF